MSPYEFGWTFTSMVSKEMNNLPQLPWIFIGNWAVARYSAADSILQLTQVSAAGYELRLILSCSWLEFRRLDKSWGWFYPAADPSSGGWTRVTADSILWLTWVPAARYELRLILPCSWLEFRRLDESCSWFYPAAGPSSGDWIRVAADSILQLTWVLAAE